MLVVASFVVGYCWATIMCQHDTLLLLFFEKSCLSFEHLLALLGRLERPFLSQCIAYYVAHLSLVGLGPVLAPHSAPTKRAVCCHD